MCVSCGFFVCGLGVVGFWGLGFGGGVWGVLWISWCVDVLLVVFGAYAWLVCGLDFVGVGVL